MVKPFKSLIVVAGALSLIACDMKHLTTASSTAPSSTGGPGGAVGALIGLWASQNGATASLNTCSNFQWNVTSQDATSMSGQFSAVCLGMFPLSGSAAGRLDGSTVHVTINATATLPGFGACPVVLTGNGTIEGDAIRVPYQAQTCVGNFSGTETLRKNQPPAAPTPDPVPPPPAPPAPAPAPDPPAPPPSADEIDLNNVSIALGPQGVGGWAQTSTITGTRAIAHELCIWHTKLGNWPNTQFFDDPNTRVEGNQWVFASIGGRWYGGAADWYRPGQACKDVTADSIGHDAFGSEPLHSWVPRVGEVFGVMSTTPARAWPNMRTLDERSNVVLIRWGQ